MGEVLVIGAARSGVAAARLLKEHGYQVTMTDSRCLEEKEALQKEGKHRRYRRRTQYSECAGQTRLFVKTHKNPLFDINPPKKETSAKTTRTRTKRFSGGFLIRGVFYFVIYY